MNVKLKMNKIIALLLLICVTLNLTACEGDKNEVEEGKNYIYYIDKKTTKIVPKEYEITSQDTKSQVEELLEQLRLNTDDVEVTKAIPDGVAVEDYYIGNGLLTISFNTGYNAMQKAQEVLTRAAVVMTLTQLDTVRYVSFSIAGQPLLKENGEAVGNMRASDFANNLDSNKEVYNKDNFTIYFANQKGTELVKYEFEAEYSSNMSKEQFIINKLLEGPGEEEGYCRTIPGNIEVVGVVTMDDVCYVTFGENFLTEPASVADELVIYSIVNSLSEISYIHKVQIAVNKKADAVYHGNIPLTEPFARNLDYVVKADAANKVE